ncbi:Uncharacterised protein [Mycobacteroides abscessus]|nr:Uncharacterised protein [Mycobacteroides abscessus]
MVGSHRFRGLGGYRGGYLHRHGVDGGQRHRAGDLTLLHHGCDRMRAGGDVLRGIRLHHPGCRECLHLFLCDVRRVRRLDPGLGSDSGVLGRCGHRRQGLVQLSEYGIWVIQWRSTSRSGQDRLGCIAHCVGADRAARGRYQAVLAGIPCHHHHQGAGGAAGHHCRCVLHQDGQLHTVHPSGGGGQFQ